MSRSGPAALRLPRPADNDRVTGPVFRRGLYRGTADYYDRFRLPYPQALTEDLAHRSGADGTGRLLDLACGTGQVCFALHVRFAEVWAVDQEPEMAARVRDKARAAGLPHVRALAASAEDLSAPGASFDLVTIGNAFHRLPRDAVAVRAFGWLRPGGFLALIWGSRRGTARSRGSGPSRGRWTGGRPGPVPATGSPPGTGKTAGNIPIRSSSPRPGSRSPAATGSLRYMSGRRRP